MTRDVLDEKSVQAIVKAYQAGAIMDELGKKFGKSRQRIQQILRANNVIIRKRGRGSNGPLEPVVCKWCKKEFVPVTAKRKYCSLSCFREWKATTKLLSDEERLERNKLRARNYYHNVFKKREGWQEKVKERNEKRKGIRKLRRLQRLKQQDGA